MYVWICMKCSWLTQTFIKMEWTYKIYVSLSYFNSPKSLYRNENSGESDALGDYYLCSDRTGLFIVLILCLAWRDWSSNAHIVHTYQKRMNAETIVLYKLFWFFLTRLCYMSYIVFSIHKGGRYSLPGLSSGHVQLTYFAAFVVQQS